MEKILEIINSFFHHGTHTPYFIIIAIMLIAGFYAGKLIKNIKLPSIIGFMLIGVLIGGSALNIISESIQEHFSFITNIALALVAVTIGFELDLKALKRQGAAMISVILFESFFAFIAVTVLIYFLTQDLALALIFGSIAPASAPAGTVAIIQEYKAKGPLTKALYTVVGFDDGLGVIIFGFAAAIARSILMNEAGSEETDMMLSLLKPLKEVGLSVAIGAAAGALFCFLARQLKRTGDMFILLIAIVFLSLGVSETLHLSLILTNMTFGLLIANTQEHSFVERLGEELTRLMPMLFILFFVLAGANLHIAALPSLGLVGLLYATGRSAGLISGAWVGAVVGKASKTIQNNLGLGILSQAGVAIGLSLIVKHEFAEISSHGAEIGSIVITTITATSIVFELIGPVLTKAALSRAGEINENA